MKARQFVQRFYDWYAPRIYRDDPHRDWLKLTSPKRALFARDLWHALAVDARAQRRSPGEIVGIDFDPFESGQDPEPKYRVGAVVRRDGVYWADVYGVRPQTYTGKPFVIAKIIQTPHGWRFDNFVYPEIGDLRSTLMGLASERRKNHDR